MKLEFDKLLKLFPFPKPRELQVEAIRRVARAYNDGAHYVVLEAPTGAGKSPLAMTFAQAMGRSYVLTLTGQLQDQYLRDFEYLGLKVLKGRGKFKCLNMPDGGTCAEARVLKRDKQCGEACRYLQARREAFEAPHCISNYHSFYWNVGHFTTGTRADDESATVRDLVVLDEAHAAETFLLDQIGVVVRLARLAVKLEEPPNEEFNAEPYFDYIKEELVPRLSEAARVTPDPHAKDELQTLVGKLNFVLACREDVWVPERGKTKDGRLDRSWFALKPLYVARFGNRLWGGGQRALIMSGTVLSAFQMVNSIGLDPEKGEHIELSSPFPAKNRPIYVGNLDMTKKARESSWPVMVQVINSILEAHATEKGILLCPSNEMLKYIHQNVDRKHAPRFILAYGEDREQKYTEHLVGKRPSVLAASGYWEGADLKGDASRFQVIPAAPRPMWQGQIAARASKDSSWYRWLTWTKFLQGTGRSVRCETDTAATYVLDRELRVELRRPDSMIPAWVREACILVD